MGCLALVVVATAVTPPRAASADTSTPPVATPAAPTACATSMGPALPPPPSAPTGLPGYHAAWYGQSGYARMCPYGQASFTIGFLNTGSLGWYGGAAGKTAYLGTWGPFPGQDQASPLGGDGTLGTPNTGWPSYDRIAVQPVPYVGPGQVAWFHFTLQAPKAPGWYRLDLRPVIEGTQWLEDQGIYWQIVVLEPDGSVPPEAASLSTFGTPYTVLASWYGPGFYGNGTACGEVMTTDLQGVADRTLPCGTLVTLRYGSTTVTVPVVDRGPYNYSREFDLTYATKLALGCPDLCTLTWFH